MKILMFGWEFPPFNSGGLGVACEGLVKALSRKSVEVIFVLPKKVDCRPPFCRMVFAEEFLTKLIKIKKIDSLLSPYLTDSIYEKLIGKKIEGGIYGQNLLAEVLRYAKEAQRIAAEEEFDIIHAHDWLGFPAGLAAKKISGKPLVVHIHATELDRTGGICVNQRVYEIEKRGFEKADRIIAVSNFTKNKVIEHYGINPAKIRVIHNAVECENIIGAEKGLCGVKKSGKKIVIFVGRITLQKGPDYFLKAAKKVLEKKPDVIFVMAGAGDMEGRIIEEAAALGISDKFLFAGFLRGNDLVRAYAMADLCVLPSVSEPFGIVALEAIAYGTPVLISKQSGVSEVITHCLKVDFWDVNEMANKILAVLTHPELYEILKRHGATEAKRFSWDDAAEKCVAAYKELMHFK